MMRGIVVAGVGWLMGVVAAPLYADPVKVIELTYAVLEPGLTEPYPSRMLISKEAVRFDDGTDSGDFAIFDRASRTIYSVVRDDRTILVIPPRPVEVESPVALKTESRELKQDQPYPKVGGRSPRHHQLVTNGAVCVDLIAVGGLLDDATTALADFRTVLAGEHARALVNMPADTQIPCDLAFHTYSPRWLYSQGLPLEMWDQQGNRQQLVDFKSSMVSDSALFKLPKGLQRYTTDGSPLPQ